MDFTKLQIYLSFWYGFHFSKFNCCLGKSSLSRELYFKPSIHFLVCSGIDFPLSWQLKLATSNLFIFTLKVWEWLIEALRQTSVSDSFHLNKNEIKNLMHQPNRLRYLERKLVFFSQLPQVWFPALPKNSREQNLSLLLRLNNGAG